MVSALPRFIQMRAPLPFLNPMAQSWRGVIRDMEVDRAAKAKLFE
jgi:hypothetical protein